jgi:hypothetical protein
MSMEVWWKSMVERSDYGQRSEHVLSDVYSKLSPYALIELNGAYTDAF